MILSDLSLSRAINFISNHVRADHNYVAPLGEAFPF